MQDKPLVSIVLGSVSDWETMKNCAQTLENFGVPYERNIASAHRTPAKATEIASTAQARGIKVIIAAAGGAAHLAGVLAAHTRLPIIGVPMKGWATDGMDSLLSTVQMPRGVPVLTVAIGKAGAVNAAIAAVQMRYPTMPTRRSSKHSAKSRRAMCSTQNFRTDKTPPESNPPGAPTASACARF